MITNAFAVQRRRAVTLFSGVGCSSLALRNLGYDVTAHEFNPAACMSLLANGFKVTEGDVRNVDFTVHHGAEVLEGGPPCQPFSQAHDGDGQFDPRDMIPEFLRAISEIQPKLFVMEEVQTLTWAKHAAYLAHVIECMEALGYVVDKRVLNAAEHGHAQARKRLFVVGVRVDVAESEIRQSVLGGPIAWPAKEQGPTMAAALGWGVTSCLDRNSLVPDARAVVWDTEPEKCLWPLSRSAMTVVGSFRPEVMAAPGYRKAGDPPRQATPGSVIVTEEERKVLMGLPRDWAVVGTQASRDPQIGNGVVVGLMQDIIDINIP